MGTRPNISESHSEISTRVPFVLLPFLGTRPNISESHREISTRVPLCIAQARLDRGTGGGRTASRRPRAAVPASPRRPGCAAGSCRPSARSLQRPRAADAGHVLTTKRFSGTVELTQPSQNSLWSRALSFSAVACRVPWNQLPELVKDYGGRRALDCEVPARRELPQRGLGGEGPRLRQGIVLQGNALSSF